MEAPNILVVDDTFNFRMSFAGIFQHAGFYVETSDVRHALQFLSDMHFDVLVLGLRFPDKGGLKLLSVIHMYHSNVQVIVLSSKDSQTLRTKTEKIGAADYLVTPLEPDILIQSIHRAIGPLQV